MATCGAFFFHYIEADAKRALVNWFWVIELKTGAGWWKKKKKKKRE